MTGAQVYGAPEGWDAFLLARRRAEFAGPMLHVARDDARMARLAEAMAFVMPEAEILRFNAWDCLPYDRVSPNGAIIAERIAALSRLQDSAAKKRILLTTVNAALQKVPPRKALVGAGMSVAIGDSIAPEDLAAFLDADGYNRTGTVMEFPDAELADWLTGRKPIPGHADSPMLRRIREAALNR